MNVAITRARCLVTVFGNAEILSQSPDWNALIEYAKENDSYYERLPIKIEIMKQKPVIISKKTDNFVPEMVSEFKETEKDVGYKLREIKSTISDRNVRILWPDEQSDIDFLEDWVLKRVKILNNKTLQLLMMLKVFVCNLVIFSMRMLITTIGNLITLIYLKLKLMSLLLYHYINIKVTIVKIQFL